MSVFVRKVKTASGARAVQIVYKNGRIVTKIDHIGSAHSDSEMRVLVDEANKRIHDGQLSFDLAPDDLPGAKVVSTFSSYLWKQLEIVWAELGFNAIADEVFKQVVLARIIEPVSKLDTVRVLHELGLKAPSDDAIYRSLRRCTKRDYREKFSRACFSHANTSGISLLLYDVTTLYFEIQKEDDFRKPGYSKERRLEPQIIVGLLVDQSGFPLMVHSFEGNKAETLTILPVIKSFTELNNLENPVIVANAAMLSAVNLLELEEQGFTFIVGSRIKKTPHGVSEY